MRIALCNEVIAGMDLPRQFAFAAACGYDGLEIAPFTLHEEPHLIGASQIVAVRRAAADAGIAVEGLHWLLVKPAGLSITTNDAAVRARTIDVMRRLIGLCAELGGRIMVHGSPAQRRIPEGAGADAARARGIDAFAAVAEDAAKAGVTYCIEPLAPPEANFINHVADAAAIVDRIGNPAVRTMVDCSAASNAETEPVAALLDRWLPTGKIAHVQVNDRNRRGPGQGGDAFAPVFAALRRHGYDGWVAVEPFDYHPDGAASAARAAGYIRGVLESLAWRA
ncbi:MAG TPA: sugar phosphate isomerase/epimerase family protein [Candidatus Cybelea sp.]|nr:sugar phosphate isomerase/epimerase family protein [Candidatus Cybelea sp.]